MYIKIRAYPSFKKELLEKLSNDSFKIFVREKAERNMANERIRQVLAENFRVPVGAIRLISGHRSYSKIFDVMIKQ